MDVARRVIVEHRRQRAEAAEAARRYDERFAEIYEQHKLPRRRPSATEIEAAGYSSVAEYMAAQMAADAKASGVRRTSVVEDALTGGELAYRPVGDGGDR